MRSPKHSKYFAPQPGNENNDPHFATPGLSKTGGGTKQAGRTTSSGKRALIDLRGAMA